MKASEFSTEGIKARGWIGPAFDQGFPDPTLLKDDDGVWWAYSTSSNGHIPLAKSSDGVSWKYANVDAMPDVGSWIDPKDRGIWAPSVFKNSDGEYIMYCEFFPSTRCRHRPMVESDVLTSDRSRR